jgi:hypothetical protein
MFHLTEGVKILTKFFYSVMDRNLALRQEGLRREPGHFREAARLRER